MSFARQGRSSALGPRPFARQGVVEMAAVGNAGEAVGVAQQLQAVVDLGQGLGALGHQPLKFGDGVVVPVRAVRVFHGSKLQVDAMHGKNHLFMISVTMLKTQKSLRL